VFGLKKRLSLSPATSTRSTFTFQAMPQRTIVSKNGIRKDPFQNLSEPVREALVGYIEEIEKRPKTKISTPRDAIQALLPHFLGQTREILAVLVLNTAGKVIANEVLFTGGINSCMTDQRVLFEYILRKNGVSFMTAHNHPSGNINSSKEDLKFWGDIKRICLLLNLENHDNFIFTDTQVWSQKEDEVRPLKSFL
jgi:DNA repair protein RadC